MAAHTAPFQTVTPEILAWLASQTAAGCARDSLLKSMVDAGWDVQSSCRIMEITPAEYVEFGVDALTQTQKETVAAKVAGNKVSKVPNPLVVYTDARVDGGDKWVKVLQRRSSPDVIEFESLLSDEECQALVDAARPRLSRSLTVDSATGGEALHPDRTSQGMFFAKAEIDVVRVLEERIEKLLGWPQTFGEGLQILRYPPGAEYKPHYDFFDPSQPGTPTILKRGGQRVATLIIYLHQPEGGGATVFPDIDMAVQPKRGNAVFFSYARADASSLTLHGGDPVTAGEKWIATKWLREGVFV